MSLKRVISVARKLGTPVIMTDADGLEPIVLLPLDQFEAMAGVSSEQVEALPSVPAPQRDMPSKVDNKAKESSSMATLDEYVSPPLAADELPLEERFYLEPLEGEGAL